MNEHMIFDDSYFMKSVPIKEIEPDISCWYCTAELKDVEVYIEFTRRKSVEIQELKSQIERLQELYHASKAISDILHNHYGDDPDETPVIDKFFDALKQFEV